MLRSVTGSNSCMSPVQGQIDYRTLAAGELRCHKVVANWALDVVRFDDSSSYSDYL